MTWDDGATFCDGGTFWSRARRLLVFYDPAPRRGFVHGLKVYGYEHVLWELGEQYEAPVRNAVPVTRTPVQINSRYVRRAEPRPMSGRPGYLLWQAGRQPVAWVDAAAWLEATK